MRIHSISDFRRAVRIGPCAWPGGYDVYAVTADGGVLCHKCMDSERRQIVDAISTNDTRGGWKVEAIGTTADTDDLVACDHCDVVLREAWVDDTSDVEGL